MASTSPATTDASNKLWRRGTFAAAATACVFGAAALTTAAVCGTGKCGSRSITTQETLEEVCTLAQCYLVNCNSREEVLLAGAMAYKIDPLNAESYSIRCEPTVDVEYLEFSFHDEVTREFNAPYYMKGNSGNTWIEPVWQLSTCGNQTFSIETTPSVESFCISEAFDLTALC